MSVDRCLYYKEQFEEAEFKILEALAFDFECELPYKYINSFCQKHLPVLSKDSINQVATSFCNDSFKLPVCLFYHPKIIAAAVIHMAAIWRRNKGLEVGLPLVVDGHAWFKWIDSAVEQD